MLTIGRNRYMNKIVIIGAGISGLSAAIYARRSGIDVTLVEQRGNSGGMCTSWRRNGYLFEGAMHWLTGSSPKTDLHQLWKETGALGDTVNVLHPDPFRSVEYNGLTLNIYRDLKRTVEELIAVSPEDAGRLGSLLKDVKSFRCMCMPIYDIKGVKAEHPKKMTFGSVMGMLPAFPVFSRLNKISCKDYALRFRHPGIQRLFRVFPDDYAAYNLIATLATLDTGDGGYPEGGSLAMAARMEKTYLDLGGRLLLRTKVKKVNIENGAVTGVTLENETLAARAVIVTQETIAAMDQLFDTPLRDEWLADLRENTKPSVCTFIGIGIRSGSFDSPIPAPTVPEWELEKPLKYAGGTVTHLSFNNYSGYAGYAPEGCAVLTALFLGDTYEFWKQAKEEGRYDTEKRALADEIRRALISKYPHAENAIDVIDIATPLTYERYTGAYHGSWMSIAGVRDKRKMYGGFLKSVSGLYFAGHRLMPPGGLPVAVFTGRRAAQLVCRQFGAVFR